MCRSCRELLERLVVLEDAGMSEDDAIERAKRRLLCYYQCVTKAPDIFELELEDDDSYTFWRPRY